MRFQLTEEGASQAATVGQVQTLHNGEALQQVREAGIRDVPLRPQLLHHPSAYNIIELHIELLLNSDDREPST